MKEIIEHEFELTRGEIEKILIDHFISSDSLPEYIEEDKGTYVSSIMTPQETMRITVRTKKGELPDE